MDKILLTDIYKKSADKIVADSSWWTKSCNFCMTHDMLADFVWHPFKGRTQLIATNAQLVVAYG